ncbi:MAG: PEP-CTERM sorting domain-containing protein [Desulfocapsaceae bacterium]|nr:PEP-CTERM sorting domain-containing protein [Desulfocapsaceae bacterium]
MVGDLTANLDGNAIDGGITCLDINVKTSIPNTGFEVNIGTISPLDLTGARFYDAADPVGSLLKYMEAAWLNTQLHLATEASVIGQIQFAMWRVFSPEATSGESLANVSAEDEWMRLAFETVTNPLLTFDYSSVRIYTPAGNVNQEFISGGAVGGAAVPEPATMILFGAGLAGLAVIRRKKA